MAETIHTFKLTPRDVLFLRDAHPMEASDVGLGANWPRPDQLYHALLAAFRLRWPKPQEWEGGELALRNESTDASLRFGALKTRGPFPKKGDKVFFPTPLDLGMTLVKCEGTDLPTPLEYAFSANFPDKVSLPQWVSCTTIENYLAGQAEFSFTGKDSEKDSELFDSDRHIGIGMNPDTGTTKDGAFYQAEYLRLKEDVTLVGETSCEIMLKGQNRSLDAYDPENTNGERVEQVVLGGQQGLCSLEIDSFKFSFPRRPPDQATTRFVRWTLLTPAIFQAGKEQKPKEGEPHRKQEGPVYGWLPAWCMRTDENRVYRDDIGKVMLARPIRRNDGESRQAWKLRQRTAGTIGAKLIAARVDKPIAFSGWELPTDNTQGGPKPTMLAVPAGSCYVFRCDSLDDAKDLVKALDYVPRSDLLGSNGFGIGACSFVQDPEQNHESATPSQP